MAWFRKEKPKVAAPAVDMRTRPSRMEGLWAKCEGCGEILYRQEFEKNFNVCLVCGHHAVLPARRRLELVLDEGSFEEMDRGLAPKDPLQFSDSKKYKDRAKATFKAIGERDAFISGVGRIDGQLVSVGTFNFAFMGGSMGSVVGEKVTRVFERAIDRNCPAIVFSASGGARMQEGIFSLMQMGKTSAAIARFRQIGKPYVSVMLHPTTGGVAASFSWLGDVILAEPKALIGFAGPRVIEQTIRQKLPEGFQRSEFLLEHGMIDKIVARREMKEQLSRIIGLLG
ncbi:acetyl-CoA carboxylase, carboxyltransferase subunit beta [Vulgatibacter sp.]|uniref:acetyl-CoA carboxylase, carboxyltransferase subunit beta n=1 Tax=Vulgatibacter sp. TaxID=1971226 RepID=UPI0035661233